MALQKAEKLDSFREIISFDEVNKKARAGLFYSPMEGPPFNLDMSLPFPFPCKILWMDPSAEAGMPHTRAPDLICLPMYWPTDRIRETVKHELSHIQQRMESKKWVKWCLDNGWTLVDEKEIPERWLRRCRINPDTMMYRFWAYLERWVPLPIYEREDTPKLRDVQVRWWDRQTGTLSSEIPAPLREVCQGIQDPEHPWEIAAYRHILL